ncbi:TetR/AcrR family transcriptional regulator [Neorhizobium sp. BETTINA12A]|jgi:AcrR family transcriptional regulator|uniref:TetR/AcrR family transcriptional regulator n=1 Tax=Neorhizobium sp. BETTINA12A TaxID=2908924 RepID=UPI001FF4D6EC|nr:TetR/AcrR family transcriptional regulator [Neorhizobium sp. BETTINA12A]MCJ9753610.1 TetR/AcrR family transcriptional regulator [Neorhizobium sp. BETTINA12A]
MPERKREKRDPQQRRADILAAAFACFSERGFAATRMEDVAARAGIAKGTVYLHFPDKEALFTELVSGIATPILGEIEGLVTNEAIAPRFAVSMFYALFKREVLETDRRHLLRLILAEGPMFPSVTEFYHRDIISKGLGVLRILLKRAAARGDLRNPAIADVPQIVIAPALLSIVWTTLFEAYEHLDTQKLFDAFLETLFVPEGGAK